MSTGIPYLGSKISLISKSEIRYEGILYTIDTQMSTVALAKVRSFGTEDRPTDRPVAPRDEVYEYIIFRGADIKDIRVCEPPKPQATLQGGLPNDPAIVKHSTSAAPGGPIGSKSHGPIGSGYGAIGSGPSHNSPIELENVRSTGSTPAADLRRSPTNDAGSQTKDRQQNNRSRQDSQSSGRPHSAGRGGPSPGQPIGFHRGGRGGSGPRGGGGGGGVVHQQQHQHAPHQGQGGNQSYRGRGGGGRGGFQPGRPQPGKKETLKFEADYDFEQANEQFQEVLSQLSKTKIDDVTVADVENGGGENGEEVEGVTLDVVEGVEEGEIPEDEEEEVYYDKQKSFFDSISCEALERSKGKLVRNDWRAEKRLNKETFGVAGNRRYGYGGRGGYYNNRGGRGFNQGGQGYNRGGGGGYGRGGQGMGQRGFGGGYSNGGFGGGYNRGRGGGGYGGQNGGGGYGGQNGGGGYGGQRGFGNGNGYDREQREEGRGGGRGGMGGGDRMGQRGGGGGYAAAVRGGGGPNQGIGLRRPIWAGDRNH
eukprot:GFUD01021877.1.p1 GENE.GFUD01021877.1~~GFUD01021877.1.p1  ORF type:complete len:534 (+),score=118.52 GFUD01021877.1:77-1678(+)